MLLHQNKICLNAKGFTLVEMIIFIALFSILLSSFIKSAYVIQEQNLLLMDKVIQTYE